EELTPQVLAADAHLFAIRPAVAYRMQKAANPPRGKTFVAANPPYGATITYYLKEAPKQGATLTILDVSGKEIASLPGAAAAGLRRITWNLRPAGTGALVPAGDYAVALRVGDRLLTAKFKVESDQ